MRLPSVSLLVLILMCGMGATAAAQQPPPETGLRRIELRADEAGAERELHIRPGVSTVLTFDVKLAREPAGRLKVELERADAFTRVEPGETVLRLVPSRELKAGDHLRLSVRFEDGAAPPMANFVLRVTADRADRLVEVVRESRAEASVPREVREAWAAMRQCQDALARVQAMPGGLTALRLSGALTDGGVVVRNLPEVLARWQGSAFVAMQLRTYRAKGRVLVEVSLRAREPGAPWMARAASLAGSEGEFLKILSVWQESPVTSDDSKRIFVEAEADESLSPESWTLWLSEDGGSRALVLSGIGFAPLGDGK
ncbi:DUF2381 family protein [Myxococcus sp. RHSTA-1-4]|uniref:DUF2381 family protein n=1 Tax=Myxococcus sp. RHSTA-1-4 TaxID=2874601 RepID=UPI001CBE00B8|nr:DUF2381 family protein [Myxococcus sp. RHSTA-1-4]